MNMGDPIGTVAYTATNIWGASLHGESQVSITERDEERGREREVS